MTIAAGINQLIDDLADAYDAFEEIGASIPAHKNTENLAPTILALRPRSQYGTVFHYSVWGQEWYPAYVDYCDVTSIDQTKFAAFLTANNIPSESGFVDVQYYPDQGWIFRDENYEDVVVAEADMLSTTGIAVTVEPDAEYAMLYIELEKYVDTTSPIVAADLASATEYANLTGNGSSQEPWTINGNQIPRNVVVGFAFGTDTWTDSNNNNANTPQYFLGHATNLRFVTALPSWVTNIGDFFLYSCPSFNSEIDLSNVTTIGRNFLGECYVFNQPLDFSNVTSLGIQCLGSCTRFNSPVVCPQITAMPAEFMAYCYAFNQPITLYSGTTSIGNSFMRVCKSYNCPMVLPSGLTTIGTYFMANCEAFNQDIVLPSTVTSIGDFFLYFCNSFASSIDVGSLPCTIVGANTNSSWLYGNSSEGTEFKGTNALKWVCRLGSMFSSSSKRRRRIYTNNEANATLFTLNGNTIQLTNADIAIMADSGVGTTLALTNGSVLKSDIAGVSLKGLTETSIGNYFLYQCGNMTYFRLSDSVTSIGYYFLGGSKVNTPLNLENVTSLDYSFLQGCSQFGSEVTLGGITAIPNNFMAYCSSYNRVITLTNVTSIGNYFMSNCTEYNQPIDLSNVQTIGSNFFSQNTSYNQPISLQGVTSIEGGFLSGCTKFNSTLTFGSTITTVRSFLTNCSSFNQPLTIPANITSLQMQLTMQNCNQMVSPIFCETPATSFGSVYNDALSTTNQYAPCYTKGITLAGTYKNEWKAKISDRTTSPYRKIIVSD